MNADSPTLKRSFASVGDLGTLPRDCLPIRNDCETLFVSASESTAWQSVVSPPKRRSISLSRSSSMPVQTSSPLPAAFPSFMSVFGGVGSTYESDIRNGTSTSTATTGADGILTFQSSKSTRTQYPSQTTYQHRRSVNSISSNSTDSSPTTTISTSDSTSITDPSPSSSPESPSSLMPLSPFDVMTSSPIDSKPVLQAKEPELQPVSLDQPGSEPNPRNVKNLSLKMSTVSAPRPPMTSTRPVTSLGLDSFQPFSAPTSPMRGPLKTGRRKPTHLTIRTPSIERTSFGSAAADVPPTPSHRPFLRHFESSPVLMSTTLPYATPSGRMQLPPVQSISQMHSRQGSESSFSTQSVSSQGLHDLEEESHHEAPKSQETQERGYPDGPVCVYDCGVYLYLEPNQDEAAKFDTVINVAKEISSPFTKPPEPSKPFLFVPSADVEEPKISEPQTAVSEISFKSAFEWPQVSALSPTTPKPAFLGTAQTQPEYIHVPWDHNSEIIDDLLPLCQIIDERINAGKTVLIHCQLGVSRSASLVIAYGIYKGYKPDFHAMYGTVKERSKWVGPNMSLIYQLMDFRSKLNNGEMITTSKPASSQWFQSLEAKQSAAFMRPSSYAPVPPAKSSVSSALSQNATKLTRKPAKIDFSSTLPPISLCTTESSGKGPAFELAGAAEPSSSADSIQTVFPATVLHTPTQLSQKSSKRSAPRPLPLRERITPSVLSFDIPPHMPLNASTNHSSSSRISYPALQMDLVMQDVPATPSLFSPRAAEFMATSFKRTSAGDLAIENTRARPEYRSIFSEAGLRRKEQVDDDPRSPHHRGKVGEIVRHIDNVL